METSFCNLELIYDADTTVRIKSTGEHAKILRRCWCCGYVLPMHYEATVLEKGRFLVVFQKDIELVSLPHIPTLEERKKFIDAYAEIVVNVLLKDFEKESDETRNES